MIWIAWLGIAIFFAALYGYSRKIDNYSWVDAGWAFGIGVVSCFWLRYSSSEPKQLVATVMISCWSLRLAYHLQKRIRRHHPEEDSRYQELRETWSHTKFFWFFQAQALSVILIALPFYFVAIDSGSWGIFETIGVILAIIGICGETLSDYQMGKFKENNSDPKAVCREGLWNYSRHPNYFFESVIWIGFFLYACGSTNGWWTFHAPLIITFLLLKVTGIPPTEESAVKRKGNAYRDYQRTTSAFIPLPPKP